MLQFRPLIASQIQTSKHCKIAGISRDCKHILFHDEKRVTVLETSLVLQSAPGQDVRVSQIPYSYVEGRREAMIERVALSGRWLAISTSQELIICQMRTQASRAPEMLRRSHGKWEPTGLALYERDAQLLLVLGQRKHEGGSFQGRVLLFRIRQPTNVGSSMPEPSKYSLPQNDIPKEVDISFDGKLFLCRTEIHNSVVIWELVSGPGSDQRSLKITRRCHTPETGPFGVTSMSIFTSCSGRQYLFCTTHASTERWRNGGEWPFCSPITFPPESAPERTIHNLETLKDKRCLVAGAVSSKANIFAVLETSGKISFLGLKAHEGGGICCTDAPPCTMEPSLSSQTTQSQICPSVLRFDPSGEKLFAVGPDGKFIVVHFTDDQDQADTSSPSANLAPRSSFSLPSLLKRVF
ncbi:MAG: hypothetical protein Q9195_001197 [Heterodermia aff. obscurata]